jgi:cytoskeletal protein CcmA (bactofilin family)
VSHTESINKHVDEITLLMYVERQLDRASAQEVSLHTQTCTKCMNLLHALDRESRLLTRAMLEQDEALPARIAEFHARAKRNMQWIWGLVFGLAVLGVYVLYNTYVQPWEQSVEQAGFGGTNLVNLLIFQGAFWKGWQSMFTLFEVFALMATGGAGMFALRKYLRRGSAMAVVMASLGLLAAVSPAPASAIEVRKGDTVTVGKDEKIKGDILLTGERVRVEGDIDGDLIIFSHDVDISGHISGDVLGGGQNVRISGPVDGNVRVAANTLTLMGTVGRNLMVWAQHVTLENGGSVGRSVMSFSQYFAIEGHVGQNVTAYDQITSITGTVAGSVQAHGESLTIGSNAQIDGQVKFEGEKPPDVATGAKLASAVDYTKSDHHASHERSGSYYVWRIIWTAAFLLFGLVLFSIMPEFSKDTVTFGEHYGASFGLGVLVLFGVPIAAIIMCITVIGLLLGISTMFLWLVVLMAAEIVVGTIVGQWVLGRATEFWPLISRMAAGVVLVRIITSVPFIGGWASFVVGLWGMGAISLALYRRLQPVVAPNIPSMPIGPGMTPLPSNTTVAGI